MSEVKDKKWYVVRAISGQENKIKIFIDNEVKRLNLSSYVEEVIVPTQKVVQIRNGKKVSKEKVYFPGYIMINANIYIYIYIYSNKKEIKSFLPNKLYRS